MRSTVRPPGGGCQGEQADFGFLITNAMARVPDAPGLGVSLDEDRLQKYANASLVIE